MSGSLGTIGTVVGGIGGALIGGPTGAAIGAGIGGSLGGSYDASKMQKDAIKSQEDIAQAQLAFNQQQYDDWKRIFGPIEDNLADYYQELDPESYAAQMKSSISNYYNQAGQNINRQLSQRGIDNSGLAVAVSRDLEQEEARQKAIADQQAKDIVEQKKLSFLGLGLGNQGALQANINNSYGTQLNLASQQLALANQQGMQANKSLANAAAAGSYMYTKGLFGAPTTNTMPTNGYNFQQWQLIK